MFLFCYERDFILSLSEEKQSEVTEAFSSASRYLDDFSNDDNKYFDGLINQIYPSELHLNEANSSETEVPCLEFHLSFLNGFISCKIYDKRDVFYLDLEIVNFPYLDGDVPRRASYGVYISQIIQFICSHVTDFNTRNKLLTAKLLNQGYRYHKLRKAVSKFYTLYFGLVSKLNVRLKSLLQQGLSEPEFNGDLIFKF